MKKLNTETYLRCALATKAVLHALEESDSRITYKQLTEAIGLKGKDEPWNFRMAEQLSDVMALLASVEKLAGERLSPFDRAYNASTGRPGTGFYNRDTRLVNCK